MTTRLLGFMRGKNDTGSHHTSGNATAHQEAKLAASKFDTDEIHVLKKTWQDLADRTNGKGIDKETFLQYFPLNGLLGERLFAQFDTKSHGVIDFDEFITGLAKVCRGTQDEKIHFLFNMYNVSHDSTVSKQELTTLLNHVPKDAFHNYNNGYPMMPNSVQRATSHNSVVQLLNGGNNDSESENNSVTEGGLEPDANNEGKDSEFEELDYYTNHDLVEKAFEECDLNHEGQLTYEEFKMWVQRNPTVLDYVESILPYAGPKESKVHHDKLETLPHIKRISSKAALNRVGSVQDVAGDIFNYTTHQNKNRNSRSLSKGTIRGFSTNDPGALNYSYQNSPSINNLNYIQHQNSNNFLNGPPSTNGNPSNPVSRNSSFSKEPVPSTMSGIKNNYPNEINVGNSETGIASQMPLLSHSPNLGESNMDNDEQVKMLLMSAMEITSNDGLRSQLSGLIEAYYPGNGMMSERMDANEEIYRTVVTLEDYLWKKGKAFHMMNKRYYLLSGNCMYYYTHKHDVRPKGVIFITGSIIERVTDYDMEIKGYYGFELLHQDLCTGEHHRHEQRVLYCKSEDQRERWVTFLQHAAHVVPIEDDYVIGKELGRGRFSVVYECVHKKTKVHCAVKKIDKASIEPQEKSLLRTEIAVLKLVNHPNIIKMEGLYESRTHIYIVMEMLKGGELFDRIVGRPRFTELEAAKLIRPLLESVAYLHDLGIVHRDLKPENILCGEELDDLKIADFGLSKMILPKEKMDSACGTLSYVAPEVLTMQGYGKEADLWSVGVIMFLLLCGKLPFDGEDHNEVIRSTIQADLKVNPAVWSKLSDDAKSLMTSLLNKNPKDRISARDALRHPFITSHHQTIRRSLSISQNANQIGNTATANPTQVAASPTNATSPLSVNTDSS